MGDLPKTYKSEHTKRFCATAETLGLTIVNGDDGVYVAKGPHLTENNVRIFSIEECQHPEAIKELTEMAKQDGPEDV